MAGRLDKELWTAREVARRRGALVAAVRRWTYSRTMTWYSLRGVCRRGPWGMRRAQRQETQDATRRTHKTTRNGRAARVHS